MEVHALIRKGANTSLLEISDKKFHLHQLDYKTDLSSQFSELCQSNGPVDFFLHNAGLTVSLENQEYYDVNVGLTEKIVDAIQASSLMKEEGVFVYTSSYAAHGPIEVKEPVSHYGRSKLQAENIIQKKISNHLIARPTGIYGSGDVAFLPLFKGAAKGLYPVADSDQRMSMIHAADLAHCIVTDMDSVSGIMHYSDGITYTHQNFIQAFESVFERKIRLFSIPKWLVKTSMWFSDLWHKTINKRPGLTLEKFTEISQHWDLHNSDLKHSSVKVNISLADGFKDALNFYKKNKLV